jgi:hypothetical protein
MADPALFSAYTLDIHHGWHSVDHLPLDDAIRYCKEYRRNWAGSLVALVPEGAAPEPYFELAALFGT